MKTWLRRFLILVCCPIGIVHGLVGLTFSGRAGISAESTILVASEGHFVSPRDALAYTVVLLLAAATWLLVWVSALAPHQSRARLSLRSSAGGAIILVCLGLIAGLFCGDVAGWLFAGGVLAAPLALVFVVIRAWGIEPGAAPSK